MPDPTIAHWTQLGSAVRDARTGRGLSQHELARQAGVSRSWLARVESGHRGAELEQILRLLSALRLVLVLRDESASEADMRLLTEAYGAVAAERGTSWPTAQRESTGS
jgi:transcriptional regulator with XRE-family HTH domain